MKEEKKFNLSQLDKVLEEYLIGKAPALPENIKELLVKYGPWLVILGIAFSLPAILAFFGLGSMFSTYGWMGGWRYGFNYTLLMVFLIVTTILRALSVKGLFDKKKAGWTMLYYSTLVNGVYSLLSLDIAGLLLGTLVSLYCLYQVKKSYV